MCVCVCMYVLDLFEDVEDRYYLFIVSAEHVMFAGVCPSYSD